MKLRKMLCLIITIGMVMTCMVMVSAPSVTAATVTNANTSTEYAENFNSFGGQNAVNTANTLLPYGWYVADRTSLVTDTDATIPGTSYKFYSTEFARLMTSSGYNTSNCIRLTNGGDKAKGDAYYFYGYGKTFPGIAANEPATGSWEISFDFRPYLVSGAAQFAFSLVQADGNVTGDNAANNILACRGTDFYIGYHNFDLIRNNGVTQDIVPAVPIGGANWYTIKVYLNCEEKYYSVELYKYDGTLVARRSPISFVGDTVSFLKFSPYNRDAVSPVFIDNVSIKKASRETTIYNETFDSYTNSSYSATTGMTTGGDSEDVAGDSYFEGYTPWRFNTSVGNAYGLENDTTLNSQVVRLGDQGGGEASGLMYMQVGEDIVTKTTEPARGIARLSFKIKPESVLSDVTVNVISRVRNDITDPAAAIFKIVDASGVPKLDKGNDETYTLDPATWYDVSIDFDVISRKIKTTVLGGGDNISFEKTVSSLDALRGIMFKVDGGSSVLVDDVKLEYDTTVTATDISAVRVGNTLVSDPSDITAGSTINVDYTYANSTQSSENVTAIAAFYSSDGILVGVVLGTPASIAAGTSGRDTFALDVPSGIDMSTVSKVSVFLWNDLANIKPYCTQWDFE